jgi:glycosyltransferase involved in cell wall biosynthesis
MIVISLIVATLGRCDEFEVLLSSLARQTLDARRFEVIVVDQNDSVDLAPIISQYSSRLTLRHVKSSIRGISRNRNIGLHLAQGKIVAFPDDDCTYYPDTLETVLRCFQGNENISIFMGAIYDRLTDTCVIRCWPRTPCFVTRRNFFLLTSSISIFSKRTDLRFDERLGAGARFGSNEDADYVLRALSSGGIVRYEPSIEVWHPAQPMVLISTDKIYAYGLGFGALVAKDFSVALAILFLKSCSYHLVTAAKALCCRDARTAKARLTAMYSRLLGIFFFLLEQNDQRCSSDVARNSIGG